MFDSTDFDFSFLDCFGELESVGITNANALVKPAIEAFLKDGIQKNIVACNLSLNATEELVSHFNEEGFEIHLDKGIYPDHSLLPESFSSPISTGEDENEIDVEHQRALNYASWMLPTYFSGEENSFSHENVSLFPVNLLKAIFGVRNSECAADYSELCSIAKDETDNVLDTLTPLEEKTLRAIFQYGQSTQDVIAYLGIWEHDVAIWAICTIIEKTKSKALRKLRHPSRSKRIRHLISYIDYIEYNEGATLDDIRFSFLHDKQLMGNRDMESSECEVLIDWDKHALGYAEPLFNTTDLPFRLIYNTHSFQWLPWPTWLLRESALTIMFSNHSPISVDKSYYSVNSDLGNYLLVAGKSVEGNDFWGMIEFSKDYLKAVSVDLLVLKNLFRKIEEEPNQEVAAENLILLNDAEQQYCKVLLNTLPDIKEKEFYQVFIELINEHSHQLSYVLPDTEDSQDSIMQMTIEELDLGVKAFNCLKRAGYNNVSDIISNLESLKGVRNLGKRSYEEVMQKLRSLGISLEAEDFY